MMWALAKLLIPAQGLATMASLAALVAWPPASGDMLLVPIRGGDANAVARVALAGRARLLGGGPLPGSLVVVGDRAGIARANRDWTIMILAAPPAGCGTSDKAARRT